VSNQPTDRPLPPDLARDADGRLRCWWASSDPDYVRYHDEEWGFPVGADDTLFEKLCLEGFQAGLSWLTILRKRPAFREAFSQFHIETVATYGDAEIEQLLANAGIVRHRGKIVSTINNARRALEVSGEFGSLGAYLWRWEPGADGRRELGGSVTPESTALSKDLKRRGWTFVGPTTAYAFMQAMGLVNDHVAGCWRRPAAEAARAGFARP
jgi:DNA-3-methyladenine glycosylase I